MTLEDIQTAAAPEGLLVMGVLHEEGNTVVLLGTGPGFWSAFTRTPEYADGTPDPIDRWSKRVIGAIASHLGATCVYPSDGPPYPPFIAWARKSGRAFASPTGLLVHDTVGLMISYRGALMLPHPLPLPSQDNLSPCETCIDQPCTTACPVGALSAARPYDVAACHGYLDTTRGADCMTQGCAARRACPLSAGAARHPAQSALHMRAFHPT